MYCNRTKLTVVPPKLVPDEPPHYILVKRGAKKQQTICSQLVASGFFAYPPRFQPLPARVRRVAIHRPQCRQRLGVEVTGLSGCPASDRTIGNRIRVVIASRCVQLTLGE